MRRLQEIVRFLRECLHGFRIGVGRDVSPAHPVAVPEVADKTQFSLERALASLQRGELDEAESIYRAVLAKQPNQPEALHFLGVVQAQRQNFVEAAELIGRALDIDPEDLGAHLNLGNVLMALQRNEDALIIYDKALALDNGSAEAFSNRGAVLVELGRHDEALLSYDQALALKPNHGGALLNRGVAMAALGRHLQALTSFDSVLRISSHQMDALIHRGFSLAALDRSHEALTSFDRALEVSPNNAAIHSSRGSVLFRLGRCDEALASYDQALANDPGYAEALLNRGSILVALARHEDALASFDRALAGNPGNHVVLLKRCATLATLMRYDEALAGYDLALTREPTDIEALFGRGVALVALRRYSDAVASYDKALSIKRDFVEVHNNRGIALWHDQRVDEALASYDRALAIRPEYVDAHFNRAIALAFLNRHAEALAGYDAAIAFSPAYANAYINRGDVLTRLRRYDDALASYDRALEINPNLADALSNRAGIFRRMGLHERAAQDYSKLLELDAEFDYSSGNKLFSDMCGCNWKRNSADRKALFDSVRKGRPAALPFQVAVMSEAGAEQLACARIYVSQKYPMSLKPLWGGERYRHDRIRVAYLSADLQSHATAFLMAELFERHDKARFEISAWSFGPSVDDDMRARLRKSFEQFNDVREIGDFEVATMLRAREIDIAVDLKGFTDGCRPAIFAHRAVPIQVNYLGYPGTMGASFMDYIIGDRVVIPQEHDIFYAEQVVRLPDSYQVNDSKRLIAERTPSRAEANLPESGFVFCCFNNNYKITPEIFDTWMRLLKSVEGSVLWLLKDNTAASRNLRSEAEARGVGVNRLIFAERMPLPEHLARHRLADLFLDTLPCNAHTTASDALWAGLPVVTCRGNTFPGRVAASLLCAIGMQDLIAEDLVDYEALALALATKPKLLSEVKSRLSLNRTSYPLFDIDRFRRHIESAFVEMNERYRRGEPPQSFSVQPIESGAHR